MGNEKIDWKMAKSDYVIQKMSYREIAEKYGVSLFSVGKHGREESWVQERERHLERVYKKAAQKTAEKQAEKMSTELLAAEKAAAAIIDIAANILTDPGQFQKHLIKLRQGYGEGEFKEELIEEEMTVIDARRLKDIASALETATKLSRTLKGIIDEPVKQKLQIERERLEIDRDKAGLNKDDEKDTGIIVLPDLVEVDEEEGIELGTINLDGSISGGGEDG